MNTFHSLVPVILVQLILQVRCVDRRGIHRLPHRPHKLPGLIPHPYPPSDNSYMNYPPYNPFLPNAFQMPPGPPMYQPPFAPFGFMPNMPPALPFSKFPSQQPPASSEYATEEPIEDFSASSDSNYMTPSMPPYMPRNPQASYTSPSSVYMPSNPPSSYTSSSSPSSDYMPLNPYSYTSSSSTYIPSTLPSSYPSPYMAPNQYNYFTPSTQPSYALSPPSSFAMSSSPSYFAPSPQPSLTPTAAQSAYMTPTSQPNYILPSSQPTVQPQSPQTYVPPYASPQALPAGCAANQTSLLPTQQQVPTLSTTCSVTFADNSTIIPGSAATENSTQINSTMPPLAAENQPPNDQFQNAGLLNSPQAAADQTPVISSNGETSTDMNSLPPQVKEFIDMIPNILAMPDSQAMAPSDQVQPLAEGKTRLSPFSLHKPSKKLPLHKRKSLYPPPAYYPPPYPAPGYPSPYPSSPYQPQSPLSVPSY